MSEWNGRLLVDMSTQHIENTMRFLEKQARRKHGIRWESFVATVYFDMKDELSQRTAVSSFGAPR